MEFSFVSAVPSSLYTRTSTSLYGSNSSDSKNLTGRTSFKAADTRTRTTPTQQGRT